MPAVTVNYVAVVLAALVHMVLGSLWYGPLFGAVWMKAMGLTKADMGKMKTSANQAYAWAAAASLVMAYILAHFVKYLNVDTFAEAAQLGFWIWLGFIVTKGILDTVFEDKNWNVYFISMGYQLASLILMSMLLATWG